MEVEQKSKKKVIVFPRRDRRAAGMKGKFTGRAGRSGWTGKRKINAD